MKPANIDESNLKEDLLIKGYTLIKTIKQLSNNCIEVEANKLHEVATDKDNPLYMPISIVLNITLNSKNHIKKIIENKPTSEVLSGAKKFAETLVKNNQISGLDSNAEKNTTHKIEIDNQGNSVIKRSRFNAF